VRVLITGGGGFLGSHLVERVRGRAWSSMGAHVFQQTAASE
jgi:nucleoside-diphosphate-sugar epimerase